MVPRRAVTAAAAGFVLLVGVGCGGSVDNVNESIDRQQDRVNRARDAITNPGEAARREADRALEDALDPRDQP